MLDFTTRYHPLTSRPFLSDESYREYPPCKELRPFIACFWISAEGGQERAGGSREVLIIPDTCMDVIIKINHTRQTITGYLSALFDRPFIAEGKSHNDIVTTFAIRFHFWAAHLFFTLDFKEAHNHDLELGALGADWEELFGPFFYLDDIGQRIDRIEAFLLKRLLMSECSPNLFNSIHQMIRTSGRSSVKEICEYCCVSQRQLERIYSRDIGLPLKRMANLVRYQNVWREMVLSRDFDIHDAVYRFGYTDQAHLLKEFRRFHGIPPGEAMKIANANR